MKCYPEVSTPFSETSQRTRLTRPPAGKSAPDRYRSSKPSCALPLDVAPFEAGHSGR